MERTSSAAHDALARCAALLDAGELVILPVGHAYALACDALVDEAVEKLFVTTGRSAADAPSLLVGGIEDVHHVAFPTPLARQLAAAFWPGSLTLVLRSQAWLPDAASAGGALVEITSPSPAFPRALARHVGPLAMIDLARPESGGAALFVDGGAQTALAPTVVDATGPEAKVLREGAIGAAEVAAIGR